MKYPFYSQRREVLEPLLVPEGEVFRPRKQEVDQLKPRDFLGEAKVTHIFTLYSCFKSCLEMNCKMQTSIIVKHMTFKHKISDQIENWTNLNVPKVKYYKQIHWNGMYAYIKKANC